MYNTSNYQAILNKFIVQRVTKITASREVVDFFYSNLLSKYCLKQKKLRKKDP